MTRGPEQRLDDIEDAITRIRAGMAALDSGVPEPQADLERDAVLYRLLVIGEAAKALPDPVRDCIPDLPWRNIMRLRDLLAHHYHRVDVAIIHATCDEPLTALNDALPKLRTAAATLESGR